MVRIWVRTSVTGAPFSCSALAQGSAAGAGLVQAFTFVHLDTVGDVAVTGQFFANGTVPPTATPTPTPPEIECLGDCDGDGEVDVTELIVIVNITLGTADNSACPNPELHLCGVLLDITCMIRAIGNALHGCPGPTPTPGPGEPCAPCLSDDDCNSTLCMDGVCNASCPFECTPCTCDGRPIETPHVCFPGALCGPCINEVECLVGLVCVDRVCVFPFAATPNPCVPFPTTTSPTPTPTPTLTFPAGSPYKRGN